MPGPINKIWCRVKYHVLIYTFPYAIWTIRQLKACRKLYLHLVRRQDSRYLLHVRMFRPQHLLCMLVPVDAWISPHCTFLDLEARSSNWSHSSTWRVGPPPPPSFSQKSIWLRYRDDISGLTSNWWAPGFGFKLFSETK